MTQYKTVAGPVGLVITHKQTYADAVKQYAAIIDREAVGGWKLDMIQQIPVSQKGGCLQGSNVTTVTFNMLVFVKED